MTILILPSVALERILIGIHYGGFDAVQMAFDLSNNFPSLQKIQPIDVSVAFDHQRKVKSLAWVQCTSELKGDDPKVKRVQKEMKDLPDYKKQKMGR